MAGRGPSGRLNASARRGKGEAEGPAHVGKWECMGAEGHARAGKGKGWGAGYVRTGGGMPLGVMREGWTGEAQPGAYKQFST
jgi:hypothetical protein